jgi:hypothetical protein
MVGISEKRLFSFILTNAKAYLTHFAARRTRNIAVLAVLALTITAAVPTNSADQTCSGQKKDGCVVNKVDLAFIIDRSGSFDVSKRGQAYNVQIDGIASALRDPSVIPRDGSVAVSVIEFAGTASVFVPFKVIESFTDAEAIAASIESLRCFDPSDPTGPCPILGLIPASSYSNAITIAENHLQANRRDGARRVMLLSSDGEPSDLEKAKEASKKAMLGAATQGIASELDVILIGLKVGTTEFSTNKERVKMIVFPTPEDDALPGAVLFVDARDSAKTPGTRSDPEFVRQVNEFAEEIRKVVRSKTSTLGFVVNTTADTAIDAPITSDLLSLRQAIEQANCLGGAATITFDDSLKDKTISPLVPLPALREPDITIDACSRPGCRSVTIDGSRTDTTLGEEHGYGILIRTNRATVRGLRIIRFPKAAIAVDPVCPLDNVGANLIEQNSFEDNTEAGVLILDPRPGDKTAVDHNVGNRISMNMISGSPTLIDLGGDGPKPNDSGDADEGPNRLLNFPVEIIATVTGNTVTISGRAAPNGVVEIFEVTRLRAASGDPIAEEVIFLKQVPTLSDGTFIATALPVSSTGFYVATATDAASDDPCANTSEFSNIICAGLAVAKITLEGVGDLLDFPQIAAPDETQKSLANSRTFTIENTGCQPLTLELDSIRRVVTDGTLPRNGGSLDDSAFFSVSSIDAQGNETAFIQSSKFSIARGSSNAQRFRVFFHPKIPSRTFTKGGKPLSAKDVLPADFKSTLIFRHDGGGTKSVTLRARINNGFQLIDKKGRTDKPLVLFKVAGNEASVVFYLYDSDRNVDRAEIKLLDSSGNMVKVDKTVVNLRETIEQSNVVRGQSFEVRQGFRDTNAFAKVCRVQVTVFGGGNTGAGAESASRCSAALAARVKLRGNNDD